MTTATKNCLGFSRKEWHEHVDMLFDVATEGEEIPREALLYAWPGKPTMDHLVWARRKLEEYTK